MRGTYEGKQGRRIDTMHLREVWKRKISENVSGCTGGRRYTQKGFMQSKKHSLSNDPFKNP